MSFVAPSGASGSSKQTFEHIFGIYDFPSGPYIALLTESDSFAFVKSPIINIRLAKKIILVPLFLTRNSISSAKQIEESTCLQLLRSTFASHQFFYSPSGYCLTMNQQVYWTMQSSAGPSQLPEWKKSNRKFFWNYEVISDFRHNEAHSWVMPFMSGYIEFKPDCEIDDVKFSILFVSRRSRHRQGCRYTRRGLDSDGHCANFVETEQILIFPDGKISSYVQVRGSIPLVWSSPCTLKYDPVITISPDESTTTSYCEDHFRSLSDSYCFDKNCIIYCLNLIDKKRDQLKLGMAYSKVVENIRSRLSCVLRYEWFDFHAETKKLGKWKNLSKLLLAADADFAVIGFFSRLGSGEIISLQRGVIRTNCMDNLDRTNVVQSLFARRSLLQQLNKLTAENKLSIDSQYKKFEVTYKAMWANNANAISLLYAGTGALKVDFTKTGKRTVKGMYADLINSIYRYYYNNFKDGEKQDGIDILLGKYKLYRTYDFSPKSEPLSHLLYKLYTLFITVYSLLMAASHLLKNSGYSARDNLLIALAMTAAYASYLFYTIFKCGSSIGEKLVVRPKLVVDNFV